MSSMTPAPPSDPDKPHLPASTSIALLGTEASDRAIDDLLQKGDFSGLTMRERSLFCYHLARKLGLDPLTKPFDFIVLNNKLTLYANRACSDQLRRIHRITSGIIYEGPLLIGDVKRDDVYVVKVRLMEMSPDGQQVLRQEEAIGCISLLNKTGEEAANTIMKCHTKALRRGTLAFCGLGMPDESELSSIPGVQVGGVGEPVIYPPRVEGEARFFEQETPLPPSKPVVQPPPAPIPVASKLPQGGVSTSAQPAAPKLPSVLPAVKP